MSITLKELLEKLWQQYVAITPSAGKIHALLDKKNTIINDHIALRTFDVPPFDLASLSQFLVALGYRAKADYQFSAKSLNAQHFEHQQAELPKIFFSELKTAELSETSQKIIQQLVAQIPKTAATNNAILSAGRLWQLSSSDYLTLLAESEYAAWLAAWGFRANHFTISVNHLSLFTTIAAINLFLQQHGFILNSVGGEIKGNKAVMLEQSAILADQASVTFSDKTLRIPSCFYEFALRYPQADGQLFQGFVEASANTIFDSTNANKG
ncbi:MAG: DUF1338 domain-containing protein [Thalassotalea sp.]